MQSLDAPNLWELVLGVGAAVSGWFGRELYGELQGLKSEIAAHKLYVAENYARVEDLGEIKDSLRRIEDKLDGKADK